MSGAVGAGGGDCRFQLRNWPLLAISDGELRGRPFPSCLCFSTFSRARVLQVRAVPR